MSRAIEAALERLEQFKPVGTDRVALLAAARTEHAELLEALKAGDALDKVSCKLRDAQNEEAEFCLLVRLAIDVDNYRVAYRAARAKVQP